MILTRHVTFISLLFTITKISSWDLSLIGLEEPYELLHVSLFYMRAFICIKTGNKTFPTLIESTWPENFFAIRPKIFAETNAVVIDETDCSMIQQAVITEVDDLHRLWVLDEGNELCEPKLIVFDLIRRNKEIFWTLCNNFKGMKVISMKIDPHTQCQTHYEVFFTIEGDNRLWIFNLNENIWKFLDVITTSPGDEDCTIQIQPTEFVFSVDTCQKLYFSDLAGNLYFGDLNQILNETQLWVKPLGKLLGQPKGMLSDPSGMVYYIIAKFGSIVRWDAGKSLQAEEHEILHISGKPLIQIFFGVRGSVWVAHANHSAAMDHCQRILYHYILHANNSEFDLK